MEEATKENFRELVSGGVTLVDVWGPSCTTCLALMPDVERLEEERSQDLKVIKLEAPKARRLCIELKLMGLPAFLMFHDGEEVARLTGNDISGSSLRTWVDDTLAELTTQRG